jgi:hypothetical protein
MSLLNASICWLLDDVMDGTVSMIGGFLNKIVALGTESSDRCLGVLHRAASH